MLFDLLKEKILLGPTLSIPDPCRSFYIKIKWSKDVTEEVIIQADVSEEAINSESQNNYGWKCEFNISLEGMRLRPISFISRSTVLPLEKSRHSFVGEAAAVRWAIGKSRKYLWGS